ncbi:MAG: bifunctional methylenetetrahydrofolate dehydrogenase/methenyltetrahydrofolate cyclohydrolase FolD [Ignavibacteriaceae bacterium]|nr:bifunctional methylenetetrahydrofolate dehydrogenase/methenyltetrahydrofolate cyclohydrolase FolD [Ignavibacteriaceae bacterium]
MILIDGKKIAKEIREEIKNEISNFKAEGKRSPGLVVILVGDNPASEVYVRNKAKACEEVGFLSVLEKHDSSISEVKLLELIESYNKNKNFDGILVQLPLPKHIDERKVIEAISPLKDVDGFHPVSAGNLMIGNDTFFSCTPWGVQELLARYNIETEGKHVVIVGRSNIVGKPAAMILLQKKKFANAIVTVCHSAAKNISEYTTQADILIAAMGSPEFIKADMVKEGAVVIDVGTNRVEDAENPKGYRLTGDVLFNEVAPKCSYITPVPGGVGPMTIAMLLKNTLKSYKLYGN